MNGKINGKEIKFEKRQTLLDILGNSEFTLDAPCGGRGVCGKCKVTAKGMLSPITAKERAHLTEEEIKSGIRLACYCHAEGEFELFTGNSFYEIQTSADHAAYEICPDEAVIDFAEKYGRAVGVATDIGTTTVVSVFYDLISGEKLFETSAINAQKTFGGDVMSRIGFAIESDSGDETLQNAIIGQINGMIKQSGINTDEICRIFICGNTTMQLTASRLSIKSLGAVPFEPLSYFGCFFSAEKLGYNAKNADIYFMPCCGGFFGGDAVACMLPCRYGDGKTKFIADIGTNGELSLEDGDKIYGCSTAAGPAFEGACIRFGTGSVEGAINGVKASDSNPDGFELKTIGNKAPVGICGSGLIDIINVCLKKELIDESGHIDDDCPEFEGDCAIKITDGIYLTQKDVREIQLAKSAICAGTIVLDGMIRTKETPQVSIAGGFGTAINLDSAKGIGLLPGNYCEKAKAVGNAALAGTTMALLSENSRKKAEMLAKKVCILDLSTNPVFQDEYVENMIFDI